MSQHPPSQTDFDRQVDALFDQYGECAFAALEGQLPSYTLFVEGDQVIAEPRTSPRHRYGAFCELDRPLGDAEIKIRVRQWLTRGEAYQRFLGMNCCRL